jgi:hypothetical protein
MLSAPIDDRSDHAWLERPFSVAKHDSSTQTQARETADEAAKAVLRWRQEAKTLGISAMEIGPAASAFECDDLAEARSPRTSGL